MFAFSVCTFYRYEEGNGHEKIHSSEILLGAILMLGDAKNHVGGGVLGCRKGGARGWPREARRSRWLVPSRRRVGVPAGLAAGRLPGSSAASGSSSPAAEPTQLRSLGGSRLGSV